MGERQGWFFEPTFNGAVKVRQADPRLSDNGGMLLLSDALAEWVRRHQRASGRSSAVGQ